MNGQTEVAHAERVAFQWLDEGGVLLHLDSGAYHRVNGVGALIWEAIGSNASLDAVVESVGRAVDGPVPETLSTDVENFVAQLADRKLLIVKPR